MTATPDTRIDRLRELISRFPKSPGVYLMKDREGLVLYVGKARDLRARVSPVRVRIDATTQPPSTTLEPRQCHSLPSPLLQRVGIGDGLVRLSVGIESTGDPIADPHAVLSAT